MPFAWSSGRQHSHGQSVAIPPAHLHRRTTAQHHQIVTLTIAPHFPHTRDAHDRRSVNASELGGIEALLHRGHRMPHEMAATRCMNADVVTLRIHPLDLAMLNDNHPAAIAKHEPRRS